MNPLQIFTEPTAQENEFYVFWRKKINEAGLVKVHVKPLPEGVSKIITAELTAIRYLLVEKEVINPNFSGQGLELHVSNQYVLDAIRHVGEIAKGHSKFLHIRYAGAPICVVEDPAWRNECKITSTAR
ncbi:MAG: hypothetical protein COA63_013110 [Methylophaga sp.]|nr:hypothetical protein [Methylophaga sp.]